MKLCEMHFTEYYHQLIVIEADDLTDFLKEEIAIGEKDCYALCTSVIAPDGLLEFHVLSVGTSWESCTRGLRYRRMLGIFTMEEVFEKEARLVETPTDRMLEKNKRFIEEADAHYDEDFLKVRMDSRLDSIRDPFYPDHVLAGVIRGKYYMEYDMRITGIRGPFLTGVLNEEPEQDIGIHEDDPMYALPCYGMDSFCLIALFAGNKMSEEEIGAFNQILQVSDQCGIDFNGMSIKS